jgi:hypothetical protein
LLTDLLHTPLCQSYFEFRETMEATIASKLDAVQLQLSHHTAALALLQRTLSERHSTAARSPDESQQHCKKLARRANDCVSPLDKDEILDEVFSFVGLGEYICAAGVSRRWRGRYIKLCYTEADADDDEKLCTYYGSAFSTAARLQLALDNKLTIADLEQSDSLASKLVYQILEPISVMSLAKVYEMKWCAEFTLNAALANKLELLQWLHKVGCPWDAEKVACATAWQDSACMLRWVHSVTGPWSDETVDKAMWCAGCSGSTDTMKFLRSVGAEWSVRFYDAYIGQCWGVHTVKLALAEGCSWDNWSCADLALEHSSDFHEFDRYAPTSQLAQQQRLVPV